MNPKCTYGHVVEYHDYTPEEDEYGNRIPGPGVWVCDGNAANLREPKTCPCPGYDRRRP